MSVDRRAEKDFEKGCGIGYGEDDGNLGAGEGLNWKDGI